MLRAAFVFFVVRRIGHIPVFRVIFTPFGDEPRPGEFVPNLPPGRLLGARLGTGPEYRIPRKIRTNLMNQMALRSVKFPGGVL